MESPPTFDWKGFAVGAPLLLVCLLVGAAARYGVPYAEQVVEAAPTLAVAVRSAVAPDTYSSTTPERVISTLTVADVVPSEGRFIAADLEHMQLSLYEDGVIVTEYPILTKGRPGTPYETPAGFYTVLTKEVSHLNKRERVYMPYSMQFYGNYFIHGWPYYEDGTPVASTYSGGCIRLSTEDAEKVFAFAERGVRLFVYDPGSSKKQSSIVLGSVEKPAINAASYLVADIDTGDVLLEREAGTPRVIASVTKLMTALVANETIMFDREVAVPAQVLVKGSVATSSVAFPVGDLLYPLLMESNNAVASQLAGYYGTSGFVGWMNTTAKALNMGATTFADPSGISPENISTADDLYRLAVYLSNKKAFIWNITRTPQKTLATRDGDAFAFNNFNVFADDRSFVGGKVGHTSQAGDTMVSVFAPVVEGAPRRVAVVVLKSEDSGRDTKALVDWLDRAVVSGQASSATACAGCASEVPYRKIEP